MSLLTEYIGSGNIYDRAHIASDVNPDRLSEIEDAWRCIPESHTRHIKKLLILNGNSPVSGGNFDTINNIMRILVGSHDLRSGVCATLHHEVHHSMWNHVRTQEQKHAWEIGMFNIMLNTGESPTKYSDSFIPSMYEFEKAMKCYNVIANYADYTRPVTINDCYPEYDDLTASLKNDEHYIQHWIDRVICPVSRNQMSVKREKLKGIEDKFNRLMDKDKILLIKKNHAVMHDELEAYFYILQQSQVFNESHSDIGAFIYAEKPMRMRALMFERNIPGDQSINEYVIGMYVDLYHRVFGIDGRIN